VASSFDARQPDVAGPPEYRGFKNQLRAFIVKIPANYLVKLGRLCGSVLHFLDAPHRRIVARNLKFTHPHWTRDRIKKISRDVFQHLCITLFEFFQLAVLTEADVLKRARVVGLENLSDALQSKNGLIIVSAHLGNWEMGLQFARCFLQKPILGVAKKIRFEPFNRWVHRLRTRFGIRIIYKKGALPEMRQALRQGGILALLVDQSRRSEGVEVQFFGKKVTATPAAAFLAIRCKSPVVPVFCIREADGQLTIQIKPPLKMLRTKDLRADVQINTQMITDAVERVVRDYPEQWFWVHKRWKKYYPELYPEYLARRNRRHRVKRSRS
jgi:Kdo2-lipid IVA lauroyltransferase/acyltransferase